MSVKAGKASSCDEVISLSANHAFMMRREVKVDMRAIPCLRVANIRPTTDERRN